MESGTWDESWERLDLVWGKESCFVSGYWWKVRPGGLMVQINGVLRAVGSWDQGER